MQVGHLIFPSLFVTFSLLCFFREKAKNRDIQAILRDSKQFASKDDYLEFEKIGFIETLSAEKKRRYRAGLRQDR